MAIGCTNWWGWKNLYFVVCRDVVLLGEYKADLQAMLNILSAWCGESHIFVNRSKGKVVNYWPACVPLTNFYFSCCSSNIERPDNYTYLGLTIHEHLDWNVTAKVVAQLANKALDLLIAKRRALGGMPYDVLKLFDSMIWSAIAYGASVWGTRHFSCIDAVQNRAQRYFLVTGKHTPTAVIAGDMGWIPTVVKQCKCTCNQRPNDRVNKRIFNYCRNKSHARCQNWYFRVSKHFANCNCSEFVQSHQRFSSKYMFRRISQRMFGEYIDRWQCNLIRKIVGRAVVEISCEHINCSNRTVL